MTIKVDANAISIRNSAGVTKFTSDNRLVYQRYIQSGSVSCSAYRVQVPFSYIGENEFVVLTITITSATGQADLVSLLINKELPANGGVIVDFYGRNVSNQAGVDTEILGVDNIDGNLMFKTIRYHNDSTIGPGTTTVNLNYTARIWSYL
jgi:hypothetical protein